MGKSNLKWEDLESKITNSPDKEELFEDEKIKKEEVDVKKNKEKIKKESNKKIIIPIISIGIIILLIIIVSTIFAFININNTNIVNGVKIEGIDVSGLTKESAKEKIDSIYNKKKQKDIILKYLDAITIEKNSRYKSKFLFHFYFLIHRARCPRQRYQMP